MNTTTLLITVVEHIPSMIQYIESISCISTALRRRDTRTKMQKGAKTSHGNL